jgi:hypothetical protein
MEEFLDLIEKNAVASRQEPGCIRFGEWPWRFHLSLASEKYHHRWASVYSSLQVARLKCSPPLLTVLVSATTRN